MRPRAHTLHHIALRVGIWLAMVLAGCSEAPSPDHAYRQVEHGDADRGRRLIAQYQCGSCHAIPDAASGSVRAGPSLAGFARRSYIAGRVPNGPDTLQRWLLDPQALVPGATMPDLGMSAEDARDIAAYLMSQT